MRRRSFMSAHGLLTRLVWNPYLVAIREGMTIALPVILAGTIAILINTFPWNDYQTYMGNVFGEEWKQFGGYLYNGTFGVVSIILALSIGHSLAEHYNLSHPMDRISPAFVSFVTFSCLICTIEPVDGMLSMRWLGVFGLLTAILTALLACYIFQKLLALPSLRIRFYAGTAGASITQAMSALFPAIITIMIFAALKTILKIIGIGDLNALIYYLLYMPFDSLGGDYLSTAIVFNVVRHALWFLGIHGSNVLEPVMQELYYPAIHLNSAIVHIIEPVVNELNTSLFPATGVDFRIGLPLLNIFTKPFFDCYTSIGGSGSTLALVIACLLYHGDTGTKQISKISIFPSIFNINEILLFGLPVVLNPIFLFPFILVPLVNTLVSFWATAWGIVPLTTTEVTWNIPIFVNAYLATGSWLGVLLQLVNLGLAVLIYAPFVILDRNIKAEQFQKNFARLVSAAVEEEAGGPEISLLSRPGAVGGLANSLAGDMHGALRRKEMHLEYQPQVDSDTGQVYGVESLMRWRHPHIGRIPPPVFIRLAEETGFIRQLGLWGIEESVRQLGIWRARGAHDLVMSVNVSAKQLEDARLPYQIMEILDRYQVPVENLKLEVTESIALNSEMIRNKVLARLHALNIQLAIDDFGMGHSSLIYLKKFPVSSIKLDAILTRDVLASRSSSEIIYSIAKLCQSLKISLVAEFVEDEQHLRKLRSLGCCNIQGYFYSAPLGAQAAFDFAMRPHKAYGPCCITPPQESDFELERLF